MMKFVLAFLLMTLDNYSPLGNDQLLRKAFLWGILFKLMENELETITFANFANTSGRTFLPLSVGHIIFIVQIGWFLLGITRP